MDPQSKRLSGLSLDAFESLVDIPQFAFAPPAGNSNDKDGNSNDEDGGDGGDGDEHF